MKVVTESERIGNLEVKVEALESLLESLLGVAGKNFELIQNIQNILDRQLKINENLITREVKNEKERIKK